MCGDFEDMTDTYATEACEGFVVGYVSYPGSVIVYVTQGTMAEYTSVRSLDDLEFDMDDPVTRFILAEKSCGEAVRTTAGNHDNDAVPSCAYCDRTKCPGASGDITMCPDRASDDADAEAERHR